LFLAMGRDAVDVASVAIDIARLYTKRKQK
jgi:hypothetical protein